MTPWFRRRPAPSPRAPEPFWSPVEPLPPVPPAVVPAPRDDAEAVARLRAAGVVPGPVELLGTAGDLPVWGWPEESGPRAVEQWRSLRAAHPATGLWPVLLGPREAIGETVSFAEDGVHEDGWVEAGLALSPDRVLADLRGRVGGEGVDDPGPLAEEPSLPGVLDELGEEFGVAETGSVVGLVPARAGWEVPALLSWEGAANHELTPAEHLCVLRWWEHRHGAELVSLGFDTLELAVARPPRSASDVVRAAREAYAYCPDSVEQSWGTLEGLCRHAMTGRSWSFWWD